MYTFNDFGFIITGHNYKNGAIFGNLNKIEIGSQVLLTEKKWKNVCLYRLCDRKYKTRPNRQPDGRKIRSRPFFADLRK